MSVTINGTTGVSLVQDGVVTPADLSTGAPTWDTAGNVGIGVTPSGWQSGFKSIDIGSRASFTSGGAGQPLMADNAYYNGSFLYKTTAASTYYQQNSGSHYWYTAPSGAAGNPITFTAAMTLDASGRLHVGAVNASAGADSTLSACGYTCRSGIAGNYTANAFNINWTGTASLWVDSSNIGTLAFTSDYRVKKNITTQTESGIDKVMRLRPVTYEITEYKNLFVSDGVVREGFIAHEVQEVIPSGAEGKKDEENRIQNLRLDAILSVAVKAIQEQQSIIDAQNATIEQLTARITALEAK